MKLFPRSLGALVLALSAAALGLCSLPASAQSSTRSISLPNQDYTESTVDLSVKVLGGYVTINRTWNWGRWYLNDRWADLVLVYDVVTNGGIIGSVRAIQRAERVYSRISGSDQAHAIYSFDENNYIRALSQGEQIIGWQWYDRLGNTIDYDPSGHILGYANAAGVKVTMARNSQNQLTGVLDHYGHQVISIDYSGGLPVKVTDNAGHSVSYQWNLPPASNGISLAQLTQVTDARGGTWTYTYNNAGYIQSRTDPTGGRITLTYLTQPPRQTRNLGGAVGIGEPDNSIQSLQGSTVISLPPAIRIGSLVDETGVSTNYNINYDRVKREYYVGIQLPGGLARDAVYDNQGRILSDSLNGQTKLQRSIETSNGVVTRETETNPRGGKTIADYNGAHQPLRIIYPDGSSETSEYDAQYRKTKYIDPLGTVSTWSYDATGNVTQYVEAQGKPEQRTTNYTYDQYGQVLTQTRGTGNGTGADAVTERFEYDSSGNIVKYTNGLGISAVAAYNSQGLIVTNTNALGNITQFSYDALGNLIRKTNALNQATQFTYDGMGRRTQITTPAGRVIAIQYDLAGHLTGLQDPQGNNLTLGYNPLGQTATIKLPSGIGYTAGYDQQASVTSMTDPAGNAFGFQYGADGSPLAGLHTATQYPTYSETYKYDQLGRPTGIIQQLGAASTTRSQTFAFDAAGHLLNTTDPNGNSTLYAYDALGHVIQITDSLQQITKINWDAQDNNTGIIDAKGNNHSFQYDKAGQLIKETTPMGGVIQYSYDDAGQLAQRTDAAGNISTYAYDAAGNLTQQENRLSGITLDERTTYTYNIDGQLTGYEQQDGNGNLISSATYTLDAEGRTLQSAITYGKVGGGSFSFTVGQSFNQDGQLAGQQYPDGSQSRYSYDLGRLAQITLPNNSQINYSNYNWHVPGQVSTLGAIETITTDALQRTAQIQVKDTDNQTLASRAYQYDPTGNITQINSDLGQTKYSYDKLNRLTQALPDNALQTLGLPLETYTYDAVGNRTNSGHQPGIWSYNADNQLTEYPKITPFSQTAPLATQVSYTPQGDTARETNAQEETNYGYNAAQRLIQYSSTAQGQATPSVQVSYRYDPFGQRISKTVTQGGSTVTTYFIYGQQGLLGEVDQTGKLTKAYEFNPRAAQAGMWSTDPLWQAEISNGSLTNANTSYHYIHTDYLGTPVLVTAKDGTASWKAVRQAFGATSVLPASAIAMNLRFPGQYFDQESGAHYNFQRDYRPDLGRYLQSDPIGLAGGINAYGYAQQRPMIGTDPRGEFINVGTAIAGCAIGAAIGGGWAAFSSWWSSGHVDSCQILGSMVGGCITGGMAGFTLFTGWSVAINAGVGFVQDVFTQWCKNDWKWHCIKWDSAILSGTLGGLGGFGSSKVGPILHGERPGTALYISRYLHLRGNSLGGSVAAGIATDSAIGTGIGAFGDAYGDLGSKKCDDCKE